MKKNHHFKTKFKDKNENEPKLDNHFGTSAPVESGKFKKYWFKSNKKHQVNRIQPKVPDYFTTDCKYDCYPPIQDLVIGRNRFLYTDSTCGINLQEYYCVLNLISQYYVHPDLMTYELKTHVTRYCSFCDSKNSTNKDTTSHKIENIADDNEQTWWQSANGQNQVFIQFDLEGEFTFSYIYMKFKSMKPGAFILEKSEDYAKTWKTMIYYSTDCRLDFPNVEISDHHQEIDIPYCRPTHLQLGKTKFEL